MALSQLDRLKIPLTGYPAGLPKLKFDLPPDLEAAEPPEARGLERDQVRLMVSQTSDNRVTHTNFRDILTHLRAGDVLVVNTSGTMNAALTGMRTDGSEIELHLSTHLPGQVWVVELRSRSPDGTQPLPGAASGERLELAGGARAELLVPYHAGDDPGSIQGVRFWLARLTFPGELHAHLKRYGFPIRYKYVRQPWPLNYYQTVFATEVGSAEMPSAGRAFTPELVTRLVANGIFIAPILLHTGVSSQESHEPPYEEYYRVPSPSARVVNAIRAAGGRVIAVGTTSVRALESAADEGGTIHPGEGWTRLVITPERGLRTVQGLLTGFHEPRSTHLAMLAALAGFEHLQNVYPQAVQHRYLWHEFGDLHLILP